MPFKNVYSEEISFYVYVYMPVCITPPPAFPLTCV